MPIDPSSPFNQAILRARAAVLAKRDFTEYFNLAGLPPVPATGYQLLKAGCPAPRGYVVGLIAGNPDSQAGYNPPTDEILWLLEKIKENYLLKPAAPEITGAHITVGGWMDTQTGIYHLDGGLRILYLPLAMLLAEQHDQIAIWDEEEQRALDVKEFRAQQEKMSVALNGGVL